MFTGIAVTGLIVFIRGDIIERRKRKAAEAAAAAASSEEAAALPEPAPASVDGEL
jgi:hypothetical protein